MSLRRKALLIFLVTSLVSAAGLLLYVEQEGRRSSERERSARASDILAGALAETVARDLDGVFQRNLQPMATLLAMRALPFFDEAIFRKLADKVVLVRCENGAQPWTIYNLRRRYVFDADLDRSHAIRMVQESLAKGASVHDGADFAGPIKCAGVDWGGFFVRMAPAIGSSLAPSFAVKTVAFVLLPAFGLLFLALWTFLSRRVLRPLEELDAVVCSAGAGDSSRRATVRGSADDEMARLSGNFNRMLDQLHVYRHELEARVVQKTKELEARNRELLLGQRLAATGTLAAGIAHEINNPLGGVLNAAVRLKRPDITPQQRAQYLALIEDGVTRIGDIVRKVLEVSPRQTTPVAVDLRIAAQRTLDFVRHRADHCRVELTLNAQSDEHLLVLGEANEIGQVLLNLAINAVDACVPGGHVGMSVRSEGAHVVLEVSDDGAGMAPEVAARAFDLFFTTKPAGEGTGLGLAMVHSVVTALGGTVELHTEAQKGTRVLLRLPRLVGRS
ncbi:MAG: HAMP domain-containing histidine kinase [Planctomycetes bacterium]|nr:HAMP domain-containing histidine kinase [Planctomycetota bacterium]